MNHNEPGFLQGIIEARRNSEIPVPAFVRQKGKHPLPKASSDAYAEKYASILTVGIPFRAAISNSIADQFAGKRRFVYSLAFYSILEDR
jgi:hypothetical protein